MLQILDTHWREHLAALDHLRQGIHLRGYAQKKPKQEYKREAFELFGAMLEAVKREVTKILMAVQIRTQERRAEARGRRRTSRTCSTSTPSSDGGGAGRADEPTARSRSPRRRRRKPFVRRTRRSGATIPCPCGSGKKYKQCHGKLS